MVTEVVAHVFSSQCCSAQAGAVVARQEDHLLDQPTMAAGPKLIGAGRMLAKLRVYPQGTPKPISPRSRWADFICPVA